MQIKRFVASSLAALMAGATFAGAALAAASVGGVLKSLGTQAAAGTPYLVVVGDTAAASDVVGAIDVASAIAQQVTKEVALPGVTVFDVEGKSWDDIELGKTGTSIDSTVLTKTHIPYLIRDKFTHEEKDYYVTEKIELPSGLKVSVDDTKFNGTLYLDGLTGLTYKYEFTTDFDISNVNVETPLEIKILGNTYYVTEFGSNSIKVMSGELGIADMTTPVTYGKYSIYAVDGASGEGAWAKLQIKDDKGNVVKTVILNKEETKTYSDLGIKIKLMDVWASTITNTVTAKILVGSEIEKTISTGDKFTDDWKWEISTTVTSDTLQDGSYIGVRYEPEDSEKAYIKIGDKLVAPNNYFEIGYPKNVVTQFATLTITLSGRTAVYAQPTDERPINYYEGLLITADNPVFNDETSSKVLIYYNNTFRYAVYDEAAGKFLESNLNEISGRFDLTTFKIQFEEITNTPNYKLVVGILKDGNVLERVEAIYKVENNKPTALGNKSREAEQEELIVRDSNKGDRDYDITTPYGIVVVNPKSNGASDRVVLKIPAEPQKAYVYVGKLKGETTAGGTYKTVVPLSLPVAKLASEVSPADKANANIVLVGGPCANSLVQALVDAGKLDSSFTCAGGIPGPAWTPGAAYVKVIEDAFATGRVALVVAGTNAADTRLATSLLSQGKLEDQTASGVKVSGTVTAPVITPM
jgi:hypothetical protein